MPAPNAPAQPADVPKRGLEPLRPAQALALLSTVPFGRVVFTDRALPAVRPLNHLVDRGTIIIRTHFGAALANGAADESVVVAYEADDIDPVNRLGWSVVVTGYARRVSRPEDIERYERMLTPWLRKPSNIVIQIQPEVISGFRLIEET